MGQALSSFKNMTQFFQMQLNMGSSSSDQTFIIDAEKSVNFIYECSRIKKMIK